MYGMCVKVRVEVGYDSVYQGFGDSGNIGNILHEAHLALISAFEQGNWRAKIVISHLQDDLPLRDISIHTLAKDATEWDNCVNGFQTQLHSLLYPTITELFGVSYRGRVLPSVRNHNKFAKWSEWPPKTSADVLPMFGFEKRIK